MRTASVTSLKTYLACPRRFYYSYVEWLPAENDDRSRRFLLSNILHTALTQYHSKGTVDWSALDAALVETWDPGLFPDACSAADEYHRIRWKLWEAWPVVGRGRTIRYGYTFEIDFAGGKFRGKFDRIDEESDGLTVVDYTTGETLSDRDRWGLQVYASVARRMTGIPVARIQVVSFGGGEIETWIAPEDPGRIENDVRRLRRAIEADHHHYPKPDRQCLRCPYAQICDAAYVEEKPGPNRQTNEMFRLFRALEVLLQATETRDSMRSAAQWAVRQLHDQSRLYWLNDLVVSPELSRIIQEKTETEGEIMVRGPQLDVQPGTSLIVPLAGEAVVLFPESVSRTAAEILGRSLRISMERTANYIAATTDGLTGLMRRELFERRMREWRDQDYALILGDIDHFKSVNDTHGHDAGDEALKAVARILASQAGAVAYRLGGEEFLLFVPSSDAAYCREVAETARRRIEESAFEHEGRRLPITVSFGVSFGRTGAEAHDVLKRADESLYRAKTEGRNRVVMAEG